MTDEAATDPTTPSETANGDQRGRPLREAAVLGVAIVGLVAAFFAIMDPDVGLGPPGTIAVFSCVSIVAAIYLKLHSIERFHQMIALAAMSAATLAIVISALIVVGVRVSFDLGSEAPPPQPVRGPDSTLTTPSPLGSSPTVSPTETDLQTLDPDQGVGCATSEGPGLARAIPETVGGLAFCPTLINGGDMPYTGPFTLEGRVIGPESVQRTIVLLVSIDPATCDTLGRSGGSGRFLITNDELHFGRDGSWYFEDDFGGYAPGVTFGRTYEFATASAATVQSLLERRSNWAQDGIGILPEGVTIHSAFMVPPGQAANQVPCEGA